MKEKNISLKKSVFLSLSLFFLFIHLYSQRNFKEFNLIGISGGLNMYNISTKNFKTKQGNSFMGGFQVRGNVYNNFDMLYGISFYNQMVSIALKENAGDFNNLFVEFNQQAVQVSILAGYKVIREHLSIEFGPVLNVNGKLKRRNSQYENYIIDGYTQLTPKDIEKVSPLNFHLAAGITAGFRNFRVFGQYQYGVTNALGALNGKSPEIKDFKGNSKLLVFGVTGYF